MSISTGTIQTATLRGLPYAGNDIYEVSVDGSGEALLPSLTFTQVHRVRTRVTVAPAVGARTSRRQVSLFFECFAEVVRATSKPDDQSPTSPPQPSFAVGFGEFKETRTEP